MPVVVVASLRGHLLQLYGPPAWPPAVDEWGAGLALAAVACKKAGQDIRGAKIMLTDKYVTKKHRR